MKRDSLPDWVNARTVLAGLAALGLVAGGAAARDQWFVRPAQETEAARLASIETALTALTQAVERRDAKQDQILDQLAVQAGRISVLEARNAWRDDRRRERP